MVTVTGLPPKKVYRNSQFPALTIDQNGEYVVEQSYVQYFEPKDSVGHPVIFVHGGGMTGACWENTPDGRDGWMQYFLKKKRKVYIVDSVERGRAGWCSIPGVWDGDPEMRSAERTWNVFRLGASEDFERKKFFLNGQFPKESYSNLLKYNVPRWDCNNEIASKNLSALVRSIGECEIVCHSQGSSSSLECVVECSQYVKSIVLLEPAGYPDDVELKKIGRVNFLFIFGDNIKGNKYWEEMLSNGVNFSRALHRLDASVAWRVMPEMGIYGNSHLLMMDRNSQYVADIVLEFLKC